MEIELEGANALRQRLSREHEVHAARLMLTTSTSRTVFSGQPVTNIRKRRERALGAADDGSKKQKSGRQ